MTSRGLQTVVGGLFFSYSLFFGGYTDRERGVFIVGPWRVRAESKSCDSSPRPPSLNRDEYVVQ